MPGGEKLGKKLTRREPRWLTSFADLMALLVCFFVLLLSFSEIDSDSFRRNAGPISEAFDARKSRVTPPRPDIPMVDQPIYAPDIDLPDDPDEVLAEDIARQLRFALADEIKRELVEVIEENELVMVRFRDRAAFVSGDRELTATARPILDNVVKVLTRTQGRVRVEGHTDDVPISTGMYRSNWDLSVARAASVVHYLLESGGVEPKRLSAEGFGDSRPLRASDTAENRAVNRRVELLMEVGRPRRTGWGGGRR